jgi:hypothetical protein
VTQRGLFHITFGSYAPCGFQRLFFEGKTRLVNTKEFFLVCRQAGEHKPAWSPGDVIATYYYHSQFPL